MKLTYDSKANVAYLRFGPQSADVECVRVSDDLNVDIAADGSVHGIEFLNPNEQFRDAELGRLVFQAADGEREVELPLESPRAHS
ncbi:MAG: DUF2283 domain-containing protein [Deltaproteobacteria bacterium]|nr:DUF2283 domain-containing protein [Deltaproteobacteria bacterium]